MDLTRIISDDCAFDACLIISPTNRRYFTEFPSSDGFLLITPKESYFFTDSRYIEAAGNTITNCSVLDSTGVYGKIARILKEQNIKRVGIECDYVTISDLEKMKSSSELKGIHFSCDSSLDRIINSKREIKNDREVDKIIAAQRIAEKSFEHILDIVKPGITERELCLELNYTMLKGGADDLSFETIVASGKNSSMPHAVPTDKKIEYGDAVTIDFGALVDGYHSDMTRTFFVGKATGEQRRIYNIVLDAQRAALEVYRAGVSCKDADRGARQIIDDAGFGRYFGHSTGHGVGVEIHERPFISPNSAEILHSGNVVSCEPGIYLPGNFGVRIEDIVLVTDDGIRNLTETPKELLEV